MVCHKTYPDVSCCFQGAFQELELNLAPILIPLQTGLCFDPNLMMVGGLYLQHLVHCYLVSYFYYPMLFPYSETLFFFVIIIDAVDKLLHDSSFIFYII